MNPFLSFVLLPEASKARDNGSSQRPLPFPFSERRRSIPTLLTRTIKKYEDYFMYKNKDYLGFYNNNNSECNRCELDSLENLFSRESLRLGRN